MTEPWDPPDRVEDAAPTAADLAPSGRTETISDGVFAIAITLLVLNLHVPTASEQADAGSALQALLAEWPAYLSYLATFLTVALIWMNHHALFIHIRYVDQQLQWMNTGILLGVCLTPFPNALVADALKTGLSSDAAKAAASAYGFVFMMTTLAWILIWGRLARRPQLLRPPYTGRWARRERLRGALGTAVYAAGIGLAWISPLLAMGLVVALAFFYAVTARGFAHVANDR
jgi:uncharacterized membrane protein